MNKSSLGSSIIRGVMGSYNKFKNYHFMRQKTQSSHLSIFLLFNYFAFKQNDFFYPLTGKQFSGKKSST